MAMIHFTFILALAFLAGGAVGQITQCNADEYLAVVMNIEALRAQFKDFKEQATLEIEALKEQNTVLEASIALLNQSVQSEQVEPCK